MQPPLAAASRTAARLLLLVTLALPFGTRALELGLVTPLAPAKKGQAVAAALLAAKHFNERDARFVPNFAGLGGCNARINISAFDFPDGQCAYATQAFLAGFSGWNAVMGTGGNLCTVPLALLSGLFGRPMVSFASASPAMDSASLFPLFTRTLPSDVSVNYAMLQWVALNGWRRIGILHDNGPYGSIYAQGLVGVATTMSPSIETVSADYIESNHDTIDPAVAKLAEPTSGTPPRIIVLVVDSVVLPAVAAALRKYGMVGPTYHYIISDEFDPYALPADDPSLTLLDGAAQVQHVGADPSETQWQALDAELRAASWDEFAPSISTYFTGGRPLTPAALGWDRADPFDPSAAFAYDAIAMLGLGACATAAPNAPSAPALLAGITSAQFRGASGLVTLTAEGTRTIATARFSMRNFRVSGGALAVSERVGAFQFGAWTMSSASADRFKFNGGTASRPKDGTAYVCQKGTELDGLDCVPCADGYVAPSDGMEDCEPCPPGTYAFERTQCIDCNSDEYQDKEAQTECRTCTEHSAYLQSTGDSAIPFYTLRGADNKTDCACVEGFYAPAGRDLGEECLACPEGGVCKGTGDSVRIEPVPAAGFYARREEPYSFLRCLSALACPGGEVEACGRGYTGDVCALCASGYYSLHYSCLECAGGNRSVAAGAIAIVIIVMAVLHILANPNEKDERETALVTSSTSVAAEIGVIVFFLQTLNLMLAVNIEWPPLLAEIMEYLSFINIDVSVFSLECQYPMDKAAKWRVAALFPLIFPTGYAALTLLVKWPYALYRTWTNAWYEKREALERAACKSINATVLAATLLYVSSARHTLEAFSCAAQPDGTFTMPSNPSLDCSSERYYAEIYPAAVTMVVLYVVGYPATLGCAYWFGRTHDAHAIKSCTSAVRDSYKKRYFFWELVDLTRKLLVAVTLNFAQGYGPAITMVLTTVIILAALRLQTSFRPYKHSLVNSLNVYLLTMFIVVLSVGGMVYTDASGLDPIMRGIFDVAMYLCVGSVLLLALSHVGYGVLMYAISMFNLHGVHEKLPKSLKQVNLSFELVEGVAAVLRVVSPRVLTRKVTASIDDDDTHNTVNDALALMFVMGASTPEFHNSTDGERYLALEEELGVTHEELEHSMHSLRLRRRMSAVNKFVRPLSEAQGSISRRASLLLGLPRPARASAAAGAAGEAGRSSVDSTGREQGAGRSSATVVPFDIGTNGKDKGALEATDLTDEGATDKQRTSSGGIASSSVVSINPASEGPADEVEAGNDESGVMQSLVQARHDAPPASSA